MTHHDERHRKEAAEHQEQHVAEKKDHDEGYHIDREEAAARIKRVQVRLRILEIQVKGGR